MLKLPTEAPETSSPISMVTVFEWEDVIVLGQISGHTQQEKLAQRGYSSKYMHMYADTSAAARHYQRKYSNQLWHSDYSDIRIKARC